MVLVYRFRVSVRWMRRRRNVTEKALVTHALNAYWQYVGPVRLAEKGYQLTMPQQIPCDPGIYRIEAVEAREIYVGEGADLFRRLGNYENAGWIPDTFSRTNRQIQKWIYEGLSSQSPTFQIYICTRAEHSSNSAGTTQLNLKQKYFRTLVEAATIAEMADRREMKIINKQFDNEL